MAHSDVLYRFLFENSPVRGELAQLEDSWQAICQRQNYPLPIQNILGEFAAAAVLLSATLKFDGSLIIQAQGKGPVSLLVIECSSQRVVRATAKWQDDSNAQTLKELIGEGQLVITIDQGQDLERYQGIVDIRGDSVSAVLENYLQQSEQLDTRIWLTSNSTRAAGLLIQKLPENDSDTDVWLTAETLSATVTDDEMLSLEPEKLIYRLFHAETVRLFEGENISFGCSCSRERVVKALRTLGYDEVKSIITEKNNVDIDCEFCGQHYQLDAVDVEQIFASTVISPTKKTKH